MEPLNVPKNRKRVYTPNGQPAPKQKEVSRIATQFESGRKTDDTVKHRKASAHWESVAARLEKSRSESKGTNDNISDLPKKLTKVPAPGKRAESEKKSKVVDGDAEASKAPQKSSHVTAATSRTKHSKPLPLRKRVEEMSENGDTTEFPLQAAKIPGASTRTKYTMFASPPEVPTVTVTNVHPRNDPSRVNNPSRVNKSLSNPSSAKNGSFWGPSGPPPRIGLPFLPPEIAAAARKARESERAYNRALRAEEKEGKLNRAVTEFDLTFCADDGEA